MRRQSRIRPVKSGILSESVILRGMVNKRKYVEAVKGAKWWGKVAINQSKRRDGGDDE